MADEKILDNITKGKYLSYYVETIFNLDLRMYLVSKILELGDFTLLKKLSKDNYWEIRLMLVE